MALYYKAKWKADLLEGRIMRKKDLKQHQVIRNCPVCQAKTIHNKRGFRNHNYREECSICDNWYYAEYGF